MWHARSLPAALLCGGVAILLGVDMAAGREPSESARSRSAAEWPAVEQLPEVAELPDPLRMFDGEPVARREDWLARRKPELKALFQHYMYGKLPPAAPITARLRRVDRDALEGKATLKQIRIECGPADAPAIDLLLIMPNARPPADGARPQKPPGVILGLNFTGNHTILPDPRIELARGWIRPGPGVVDHKATEAGRGTGSGQWQADLVIDRGYALATFYYGDVMPDDPEQARDAVKFFRALNAKSESAANFSEPKQSAAGEAETSKPNVGETDVEKSAGRDDVPGSEAGPQNAGAEAPGAILAWAWGLHRAIDYLASDADVDAQDITVYGHSRNGKAALVAAAFDERVRAVIPHQAGCGGSAPSRCHNPRAETVSRINRSFPHWFNAEFKKFGGQEDRLPLDQHCLVALCFPRPVFFTCGREDQWANPPGQLEVLKAAGRVYSQFGVDGIDADAQPELDKRIGARLCYLLRDAGHIVDRAYWEAFLDFADQSRGEPR